MLKADGLMSIKRDRVLFENLVLSLQQGEVIHLKGPNGAGKTTLMRILAGLSDATEGNVYYNETLLQSCRDEFFSNSLYIGHKSALNPNLTAIENTFFWAAQHSIKTSSEQVLELLAMIGLLGHEDLPVGYLSAGQQRRVALLRLWLKPKALIWFLDEPFTALDTQGITLIEAQIYNRAKTAGGVIVTSHQQLTDSPFKRESVLEYRL